MNDNQTIIAEMQQQINELLIENQRLKSLLHSAGISYEGDLQNKPQKILRKIEPDQGARILPHEITEKDPSRFFSMFWGRLDVYCLRYENAKTGATGYYPQCHNFWKNGCPKKNHEKTKCIDCPKQDFKKLTVDDVKRHLFGGDRNKPYVIGIYPLFPDDTCRFLVFDFDNHEKGAEKNDLSNNDDTWMEEVDSLRKICEINGIDSLVERSRSGCGAHVWIFFEKPVKAAIARKFGYALLDNGAESINLKSFRCYDRMLPMQDHIPEGGLGNLIALPLQGQALRQGNSAFVDANWNAYPDQWKVLLSRKKLSIDFLNDKLSQWETAEKDAQQENSRKYSGKPWDKSKEFHPEDIRGNLKIILADGIYIETRNIQPRLQNQIRRLAAFSNPVFYKNQRMGLSNFSNARFIYLGSDIDNYIKLPRGVYESLTDRCASAGISCSITDQRCNGQTINVRFRGKLKSNQRQAAEALLKFDNGILNAATAFGKTVVCCKLIAERKVNTLILLESSALIEQWEKALETFLEIDEDFPEYITPSGRKRRRKSLIGLLQNTHDSTGGIIDISMVGSVRKKGEFHKRFRSYGMVILDECHHGASETIADLLQETNARYVYGVTATPMRGDQLEKITYMLLGPIRFRFTSKDRAKEQGIEHLVYPRFTHAVIPRFNQDNMHPNEAYEIIRNNSERDKLIVHDTEDCIQRGRTPVILTRYIDHAKRLYAQMQNSATKVFLLTGELSKAERREALKEMAEVPRDESMLLIATGKLIGEGFDFPRLDTLIMATPVSFKGVVEQYAGRLNRDYEGKKDVLIYDYVDSHISIFDRMYAKRLKAYKQIGYSIYSLSNASMDRTQNDGQINAIFDSSNYRDVYWNDLLQSKKEIIISSPVISSGKIDELISKLKEKQEHGLRITVVTWSPDVYKYGDTAYWTMLQEHMRTSGIEIQVTEDYCEHYCIIDRNIVWYGSMNFLGKEDAEDNLMRISSESIASELLENTFSKNLPAQN